MRFSAGAAVGPYTVVSVIGAGAMGEVYRAHDPRLGRDVAIKVLSFEPTDRDQRRFLQEARSASALTHPNVVTVHEVGEYESVRYVVMELVDGERLRDVLHRGPVPLRRAIQIAHAISAGLAAAHGRGVIHRDLKPENVMISRDGQVKLVDFGLAHLEAPAAQEGDDTVEMKTRLTQAGTVVGTVGYMSPELLSRSQSDARGDQFALGVVVYEMLSGRNPFQREIPVETMYSILHDDPPPLRGVPPEVTAIVMRCLQRDPSRRFETTAELCEALETVLQGITSPSAGATAPALRRWLPVAGITAAGLVAILAGLASWHMRADAPETPPDVPERRHLAILPFAYPGGDQDAALWTDGLMQVLGARLSRGSALEVITPFGEGHPSAIDAARIARELGADIMLRGTVHREPGRTRIAYTLLDPTSGRQLSAAVVTGLNDQLFELQDELAEHLARDLRMPSGPSSMFDPKITTSAAQDRYLQTLGLLQRYDDLASVERAISLVDELSSSFPESALLHAVAGRAFVAHYDLTFDPQSAAEADRRAREAAALDPRLLEARLTLGEVALRTGRSTDAIESFRSVLAQAPESPDATLALARALAADGQLDAARREYRRAIALRPGFWGGYNRFGQFLASRGELPEALAMFERAARLSPENGRVKANMGATLVQLGRIEEATAMLEEAVRTAPTGDAWSNLGTALYLQQRFDDAIEPYENATRLSPGDPFLWANLGDALRASTTRRSEAPAAYARAVEQGSREIEANPANAVLLAVLASCQAKSGNRSEARILAGRAVERAPDDPTVLYHSAVALAVIREDREALALLARAFRAGYPPLEATRERELARLHDDPRFTELVADASQ